MPFSNETLKVFLLKKRLNILREVREVSNSNASYLRRGTSMRQGKELFIALNQQEGASMKNATLRFFVVQVVVLLLLSTFVLAKGKPTNTYSWSVTIRGENLQPVEGSTYTVRTSRSSDFSEFRFEALAPESAVIFAGIRPIICYEANPVDCDPMFDAIGADDAGTGANHQPDGNTYKRILFKIFFNGLDFENMAIGAFVEKPLTYYDGVGFAIDEIDPSLNRIWADLLEGTVRIERESQSTWSVKCDGDWIYMKKLEAQPDTSCRGKKCITVVSFNEVAHSLAGPMVFDLTFTRSTH